MAPEASAGGPSSRGPAGPTASGAEGDRGAGQAATGDGRGAAPAASGAERGQRAGRAEASITARNLRRFWGFPLGSLGTITVPGPLSHRLFVHYNYWWQAHLMDCLIDAELREPDAARRRVIRWLPRTLWVRNRGTLVNDYFDDVAWLALAMGRARREVGIDVGSGDLHLGRHLHARWRSDAAGGGIPWRRGDVFRNVPANGSMAIVMARLGRLERTEETIEWIYRWLHDPGSGMIWEGRRPDGIDRRLYTYNQGLVLGALLELVAAGRDGWRPHLHALVGAIVDHCAVEHVLNPCGGGDGGLFAAITARYLALTALELPGDSDADVAARTSAALLVRRSADAAWEHRAEDGAGVWFGADWSEPAEVPGREGVASNAGMVSSVPASRDLSVQLGGWMVQELAARLDRAGVPVA